MGFMALQVGPKGLVGTYRGLVAHDGDCVVV